MILTLMLAATALLALGTLVFLCCRFQGVGLFGVLAAFFVQAFFLTIPPFESGGMNFYPEDLVAAVLIISAVVRLAFRRPGFVYLGWGLFALAAFMSFYLGAQMFGQKASANEFRHFCYLIAAASYFSSFDYSPASVRLLKRAWFITAGLLITLAIYRWGAEWFGLPSLDTWAALRDNFPGRITRTLNAAQTLFLLQTWLLTGPTIRTRIHSKLAARLMTLTPLLLVFVLQHRTVWVAAIGCFVFLFGRIRTLVQRPIWVAAATVTLTTAVLALVLMDPSNPIVASIRYSVQEPLDTQHSTFAWRVDSWQQLVQDETGPTSLRNTILGYRPFGAGLRRRIHGSVVNVSAHNYYVDTLMRTGALGLIGLLLCYGAVVWKLGTNRFERDEQGRQWRTIVASLLVSQLVYYFGYAAAYEQGIILGFAISLAMSRRKAAVRSPFSLPLRFSGLPARMRYLGQPSLRGL